MNNQILANKSLPPVWLLILIVGLPQLSETIYTPSLPAIADALATSNAMVEHTLTIYLFAFALGTFFWGRVSDFKGRKPCVILGLLVFITGCIGCYYSTSIEFLMASRFVQAFGGSIGSVLGQSICRDAFHGPALGKAYSSIGSALALFPALGPVAGGMIADEWHWRTIFIFLMGFGTFVCIFTKSLLKETHPPENRKPLPVIAIARQLITDRKVLGYGLIVAACGGIFFSYFAEGSFYLIDMLGLTPTEYGFTFMGIGGASMLGGLVSKRLHSHRSSRSIMDLGLLLILISTSFFSIGSIVYTQTGWFNPITMICLTVISQMLTMFGYCIATSNALALSLAHYKHCIGTASSLFGFFYYCLISIFAFGMGVLHNGKLLVMPLYFCSLAILMWLISKTLLKEQPTS